MNIEESFCTFLLINITSLYEFIYTWRPAKSWKRKKENESKIYEYYISKIHHHNITSPRRSKRSFRVKSRTTLYIPKSKWNNQLSIQMEQTSFPSLLCSGYVSSGNLSQTQKKWSSIASKNEQATINELTFGLHNINAFLLQSVLWSSDRMPSLPENADLDVQILMIYYFALTLIAGCISIF